MLSIRRPLPSILIWSTGSFNAPVKALPVYCAPWSVLSISGVLYRRSSLFNVLTQKSSSLITETSQESTYRQAQSHYCRQINKALSQPNVSYILAPHLIRSCNSHPFQQIRINPMSFALPTGVWLGSLLTSSPLNASSVGSVCGLHEYLYDSYTPSSCGFHKTGASETLHR